MASTNASANASTPADNEARLAALEARMTAAEQKLDGAISNFAPVAGRVSELSSAFLDANARLTQAQTDIAALQTAAPPPSQDAINALSDAVAGLAARVSTLEQTRARGGRLSDRLASIETKLDQLAGGTGGTTA